MTEAQPRLDSLAAAREAANADPAFRKLGTADLTLGLSLGGETRLVRFEAFEVAEVSSVKPVDLRDADIVLEMSPREWNDYLGARARGEGPTLLSLDCESGVVRGADPLARLKLERYNRSIQAFVDLAARGASTARQGTRAG